MPEQKSHDNSIIDHSTILTELTQFVCKRLRLNAAAFDPKVDLARYGLDSMEAVQLTVELERLLGITLEDSAVFDHPTLNALVDHAVRAWREIAPDAEGQGA
ncbi:MAG: acyl carrier protein [Aquisalimonadaceae bacterium]